MEWMNKMASYAKNIQEERERKAREVEWNNRACVRDFKAASANAMEKWNDWTDSLGGLDEVQQKAREDDFIKYACSVVRKNSELLREARELAEAHSNATGDAFKNEVLRIFKVAFKGTRARNVCILDTVNPKICIGPAGFALRPHVQASPVWHYSDMAHIVTNKDEVIKGLKKNNMAPQAKMFRRFCELIPEIGETYEGSISVLTEQPVILPKSHISDKDDPPKRVDRIFFNAGENFSFKFKSDRYHNHWDTYTCYYAGGNRYGGKGNLSWTDALVFLQVSPQLERCVERFKNKVTPSIEKSKDAIDLLQKEFGRQLFADAL